MVRDLGVWLDSELTSTVRDLGVWLDSELTSTVRDLGVWLDSELTMHDHISDLLILSRPLWYEILVSGWTANSQCMTISREQHLLVSSVFIGGVSFVASSAVLPCSDLFQRLYYQDWIIAMWCCLDFRLRH